MINTNIGRLSISKDKQKNAECFHLETLSSEFHQQYGLQIIWIHKHGNDQYSPSGARQWIRRRYFANYYNISHLISGHGWLCFDDDKKQNFNAGDGVIMFPGIIHDYNAYDHYCEDSLAFAGPLADHLAQSGILKPGILHIGNIRRLLPVIELAANPENDSQLKANIKLQNLLIELYFENRNNVRQIHKSNFADLLKIMRNNPDKWWSVNDMAEAVGLSINHFIREFRNFSGFTPKNYIDNMKINMASEDLRNSTLSVAAIAWNYGYKDVYHFSRRFKQITGVSPVNYRKAFSAPVKES